MVWVLGKSHLVLVSHVSLSLALFMLEFGQG